MNLRHLLNQYVMANDHVDGIKSSTDVLELTDSVFGELNSLSLYGKTVERTGIPFGNNGYTQLETLTNAANTYFDTGIAPDIDDMEFEIKVKPSLGSWYILQCRDSNNTIRGLSGGTATSSVSFVWKNIEGVNFSFSTTRNTSKVITVNGKFNNGVWTGWLRNDTDNVLEVHEPIYYSGYIPSNLPLYIFGNQNSNYVNSGNKVYYIKIHKLGKLVRYLIPAKSNNTNTIGFYDIVTGDFLTPKIGLVTAGTVINSWESNPDFPLSMMCNNGNIRDVSENLFNPAHENLVLGEWLNNTDGQPTASGHYFYNKEYIPVNANQSYVFFGKEQLSNQHIAKANIISWYASDKTWISNSSYSPGIITIDTAPQNAVYARLSCNIDDRNATFDAIDEINFIFYEGVEEKPFIQWGNIITNYNPESLIVTGKNLFDKTAVSLGYIDATGNVVENNEYYYSSLIPVEVGSTYVFSGVRTTAGANKRLHGYNSNGTWIQQLAVDLDDGSTEGPYYLTVTIPAGISYVKISGMRANENEDGCVQFEKSPRPTKYEDYVKKIYPVLTLLSTNDIQKDSLDLESGILHRRVYIRKLTGTESWTEVNIDENTKAFRVIIPDCIASEKNSLGVKCTHFSTVSVATRTDKTLSGTDKNYDFIYGDISDVEEWKEWLVKQNATGTPVLVLYPLETEAVENIKPKRIYTVTGTNTIERVTSSITGLDLSADYKKLK